jgi:hypothetical protein
VGAPSQNVWCGSNTVVVAWDRTVVMVGPFGETLKCVCIIESNQWRRTQFGIEEDRYFYSDPVYLIGEIDGTRIISRDHCEFLQKVPRKFRFVELKNRG